MANVNERVFEGKDKGSNVISKSEKLKKTADRLKKNDECRIHKECKEDIGNIRAIEKIKKIADIGMDTTVGEGVYLDDKTLKLKINKNEITCFGDKNGTYMITQADWLLSPTLVIKKISSNPNPKIKIVNPLQTSDGARLVIGNKVFVKTGEVSELTPRNVNPKDVVRRYGTAIENAILETKQGDFYLQDRQGWLKYKRSEVYVKSISLRGESDGSDHHEGEYNYIISKKNGKILYPEKNSVAVSGVAMMPSAKKFLREKSNGVAKMRMTNFEEEKFQKYKISTNTGKIS